MTYLENYRSCVLKITEKLVWFPPLLSRVTLAGIFMVTGWGKIHNIEKVIDYFTQLGIPYAFFQAHLVAYTELICGTLVLLGFLTRLAVIPLSVVMSVAIATAKATDIQFFNDIFGFSEYLYIVLCIWLLILGPGKFSIDHLLFDKPSKQF